MPTYLCNLLLVSLIFFLCISIVAEAIVPSSKTFKFINEGDYSDFDETSVEYYFRFLDPLHLSRENPFGLGFCNPEHDSWTFGIFMGGSSIPTRWVWEANRGNPVGENASLSFGTDGNLVLRDTKGSLAWQTGTANKGVVGMELLQNGNLVLVNKQGRFVWQSFDHPTDTLLVGQGLYLGGVNKLTSRYGGYSFVVEKNRYALYLNSKNSRKPLPYYAFEFNHPIGKAQENMSSPSLVFRSLYVYGYLLTLDSWADTSVLGTSQVINTTLSMFRLESDGNIRVYTYSQKFRWDPWVTMYTLFGGSSGRDECSWPSKCGSLGVCGDDGQCVGCPTPKGWSWWSRSCAPPKLPRCGGRPYNVTYYRVDGVQHFTQSYSGGEGPMKIGKCRDMCTEDCGCLGFFFEKERSLCLLAPELRTLTKTSNPSFVGYIKISL
ncbi:hypothetical protein ACHQM5_006337 [Ranunculus cassubicifolius]